MSSRPIRVVRGTAAAALSVFVALFAHVVLGGGALPGVLGIAVPLILALPVCVLLAGRRASLVRLGLSVVLGQVAFNALFVLGAPATGAVGSAHHGMGPVAPVVDVAAAVAPSAAMWGAHAVATVVTVALLFVAERRVELAWRVASIVRAWVARVVEVAEPAAETLRPPVRLTPVGILPAPPAPRDVAAVRHRGPPALLAS